MRWSLTVCLLLSLAGCTAGAAVAPCCTDPAAFPFQSLPERGRAEARIDGRSPVFEFQSGPSPFVAFELPRAAGPYQLRVKSLFQPAADGGVFYPVLAVLDETFVVLRLTSLDNLRLEPALATPGGESGLAVTLAMDPAAERGRYLVVFTPAALLGPLPEGRRENDLLTPATINWLENQGDALVPPTARGRLQITVAPQPATAAQEP
ncbi:MAG: hypothetical protein FJ191_10795 [Gammaproteobacteria bacterium]|nr:hypothetical protein [Gammaproteobacteria bacterium]